MFTELEDELLELLDEVDVEAVELVEADELEDDELEDDELLDELDVVVVAVGVTVAAC